MRPVIKRRRIDPRYFLHETTNRGNIQESNGIQPAQLPGNPPPEQKPPPVEDQPPEQLPDCPRGQTYSKEERRCIKKVEEKMADKDYDGDGEVESSDAEWKGSRDKAIKAKKKKKSGKKEHEKSAKGQDRDPQTSGTQKLLLGDKNLYEKIRGAIEEVFDEYLEENK